MTKSPAFGHRPADPAAFDYARHTPFQIVNLGNRITNASSRAHIERYDIGVIEGRILTKLSEEPNATAAMICSSIDLDQAAASRSLRLLEERGYVLSSSDKKDTRRRRLKLSKSGRVVRDELVKIAHQREELLLTGFSAGERELLREFLNRLRDNSVLLDDPTGKDAKRAPARSRGAKKGHHA